jgi:tetratricopeptide (TPR) repeat protein
MSRLARLFPVAGAAFLAALPVFAAPPISLRDSFPLGSGAGALCSVQLAAHDPAATGMFDRAYAITCRDAAVPVGHLYALRNGRDDPAARLAALRAAAAECAPAEEEHIDGLGPVQLAPCRLKGFDVPYRVYSWRRGGTLYVAEGLAGYDSALRLGLRTLVADRPVPGEIAVATTGAGDPAAFARVQAGALDPAAAIAEAYRRNNGGSYAEAAEFFSNLAGAEAAAGSRAEAMANDALQQSDLGDANEASRRFDQAAAIVGADPVVARMLRNYRAIAAMNRALPDEALAELARPLPPGTEIDSAAVSELRIDARTAARLNAETQAARQLGGRSSALLPEERAQLLDAQAQQIRGTLLRLQGRPDQAEAAFDDALVRIAAVRNGRVVSIVWMRAQIDGERAAIAESRGNDAEAERLHRESVALVEAEHPGSPALLSAQGRLAGFYARKGRIDEARALYRAIVDAGAASGIASPSLRRALAPYFALLAAEADRPDAVAELFRASQLLVRPGVAQTQAVLARELSGGSDEAARLFRQSVNLGRDVERVRVEIGRLAAEPKPIAEVTARLAAARSDLQALEAAQVAAQSKLAQYPRYRVVSGGAMTLAELQKMLRPGEAYYKMILVGEDGYGLLATPTSGRAFRLGAGPAELDREVDAIRATISVEQQGKIVTYPFDVERAYRLYGQLFGPAAAELAGISHLIFEPDGAMLRLPPNLLVTDRAGVDAYLAKARRPDSDGFDFTDLAWLGRGRDVSTAVSARAFRDVRQAAPSRAGRDYIGFGENRRPQLAALSESALRAILGDGAACGWPIAAWAHPISAAELRLAAGLVERKEDKGAAIVTGQAFSDDAIKSRADLSQYRIVHFATHGLVTAPRPECPARPALMTSFGGPGSDGLLSFGEIYDLRIDADLVILSACDTAGKASLAATREAGVATGGGDALDGLVRAFVGAGGRSVIASHWPVPDDYDATDRLISGLFTAPPGTATATALRRAEAALMADPKTSHPYYWAGFAIVGDGAAPVLRNSGR